MKWFQARGQQSDVAVSTRIRLARNVKGLSFGSRLHSTQAEKLIEEVKEAAAKGATAFSLIRVDEITPEERMALYEKHLISREMMDKKPAALLLSEDESISVMINEEDHLRIQVMSAGIALKECLEEAMKLDALLQQSLYFAYDQELGFLTQCPTNLGTGLRASVMLHLPMLTRTGQINAVISAANKIGLEIRGLYGQGSKAEGEFYQVSNSITLGLYEEEICEKLKDAVERIIQQEQNLRQAYRQQYPGALEDRVWRAAGLLRYARKVTSAEAEALLSDVRLGQACGILAGITAQQLNQLIYEIAPACIELTRDRSLTADERDMARADLLREALQNLKEPA